VSLLASEDSYGFLLGVAASIAAAVLVAVGVAAFKGGLRPAWAAVLSFVRLYRVLGTVRMRCFVRDRSDYRRFRGNGREMISSYVSRAKHDVTFVSISLVTGVDFENLTATLRKLTEAEPEVLVRVSLLNPEVTALMTAIAPVLRKRADEQVAGVSKNTVAQREVTSRIVLPRCGTVRQRHHD